MPSSRLVHIVEACEPTWDAQQSEVSRSGVVEDLELLKIDHHNGIHNSSGVAQVVSGGVPKYSYLVSVPYL